jgi:hypothetical protein
LTAVFVVPWEARRMSEEAALRLARPGRRRRSLGRAKQNYFMMISRPPLEAIITSAFCQLTRPFRSYCRIMNLCRSCSIKQCLTSTIKCARTRPQIRSQASRLLCRRVSTQTENDHVSHLPQFVPIRERLARWQIEQEKHQSGLIPTLEVLGRGGVSQYSSTVNNELENEVDAEEEFELIAYNDSISGNAGPVLRGILQAGDLVELT